jgi:hypothetical protein
MQQLQCTTVEVVGGSQYLTEWSIGMGILRLYYC